MYGVRKPVETVKEKKDPRSTLKGVFGVKGGNFKDSGESTLKRYWERETVSAVDFSLAERKALSEGQVI